VSDALVWLERLQRVRRPRIVFERIRERIPAATADCLNFVPPALVKDLRKHLEVAPSATNAFEAVLAVIAQEEAFLQQRLTAQVGTTSRCVLAMVHDTELRARSVSFSDGSEAITMSTGFVRFFGTYCRILTCHLLAAAMPSAPARVAVDSFARTPASFEDAQFAAIALFTNYVKLGVPIERIVPTAAQGLFAAKLYGALVDFVIAHELVHLRSGHVLTPTPSLDDEYKADEEGALATINLHGTEATLLALRIFFGASIGICRHLDDSARRALEFRENHAIDSLDLDHIDADFARIAGAFRQTSVGCSNAVLDAILGRTVLETALEKAESDAHFLDAVLRWFLMYIPERAINFLGKLALRVFTGPAESAELRRLALLCSVLDDSSRLEIERALGQRLMT
jgi:hypothetical protein